MLSAARYTPTPPLPQPLPDLACLRVLVAQVCKVNGIQMLPRVSPALWDGGAALTGGLEATWGAQPLHGPAPMMHEVHFPWVILTFFPDCALSMGNHAEGEISACWKPWDKESRLKSVLRHQRNPGACHGQSLHRSPALTPSRLSRETVADGPGEGGSEAQPDLAASVTHQEERLMSLPGSSWHCPVCPETGQKICFQLEQALLFMKFNLIIEHQKLEKKTSNRVSG